MSNELRIYRFAPDQPGKGGQSDGFHDFIPREDVRHVKGFKVRAGTWERDATGAQVWTCGFSDPVKFTAFAEWPRYNLALQQDDVMAFAASYSTNGGYYYSQWYELSSGQPLVPATYYSTPVIPDPAFVAMNDRVALSCGGIPYLWDGSKSGANPTNIVPLGVPTPAVGPTVSVSYNWTDIGTYYKVAGSAYICQPNPAPGTNWTTIAPGETLQIYNTATYQWDTVIVDDQVTGAVTGLAPQAGAFPIAEPDYVRVNFSGNSGSTTISINVLFPSDGTGTVVGFVGLRFVVDGTGYMIVGGSTDASTGLTYLELAAPLSATYSNYASWTIDGTRIRLKANANAGNIVYGSGSAHLRRSLSAAGYVSWSGSEGPGYAYAYFDPVSGHISNLSPITYVTEKDVVNGKIGLNVAQSSDVDYADGGLPIGYTTTGGIQYPGPTYHNRFTHIVFFRTRKSGGGAVLYPIGSLNPTDPKWMGRVATKPNSGTTWYDSSTDLDLLVSGRIRAPIDTNYQPAFVNGKGVRNPMAIWGMSFWDGRLWVWGPDDQYALHYSCDSAQNTMGRPEESFPDLNRLVLPAAAGPISAILTAGAYLVVVARRGAYVVQGNHESNYRLVPLSSELYGVRITSLCAINMGDGGSTLAVVTKDRRVLVVQIGGGVEDVGRPIQSRLWYPRSVAFYRANGTARLVVVSSKESDSGAAGVYEYDFTNRIWTQNDLQGYGEGAPYTNTQAVGTVGDDSKVVSSQVGDALLHSHAKVIQKTWSANSTACAGAFITTCPLPGGHPGKRIYSLAWVRAVLLVPTGMTMQGPTLQVRPADHPAHYFAYTMAEHTDPALKLLDGWTIDGQEDAREFIAFGASWTSAPGFSPAATPGQVPTGRRMSVVFAPGVDTVRWRVAYIEVALRELSEDGSVDP